MESQETFAAHQKVVSSTGNNMQPERRDACGKVATLFLLLLRHNAVINDSVRLKLLDLHCNPVYYRGLENQGAGMKRGMIR